MSGYGGSRQGGRGGGRGGGGGRHGGNNYHGRGGAGGRNSGRGGRDGGRGGGRGGRGGNNRPDLSGVKSCETNIILSEVSPAFSFKLYSLDARDRHGEAIDSVSRRGQLFQQGLSGLLAGMPKNQRENLESSVFFSGSFFFSAKPIPGLEAENLPKQVVTGENTDGDNLTVARVISYTAPTVLKQAVPAGDGQVVLDHRCKDCVKAFNDVRSLLQHCTESGHAPMTLDDSETATEASPAVFLSYVNCVLQRALSQRLARWSRSYIDPSSWNEPTDRHGGSLGITVYQAYSCEFGLVRPPNGKAHLSLTVDLGTKILRSTSVLDALYDGGRNPNTYKFTQSEMDAAKRNWIGTTCIYKTDKKTYTIVDIHFDQSAASLPVEGLKINGKAVSHADYFRLRKNITLQYPNAKPLLEVQGTRRGNQNVFLPAELVCADELPNKLKEMLPQIASYKPEQRTEAIERIKKFLIPGAQKSKGSGLLPACGIRLKEDRLQAKCTVMPIPMLVAAGVNVPQKNAENWAPLLGRAKFSVNPKQANKLQVIVFYSKKLSSGAKGVFETIKGLVNGFQSSFVFGSQPELVECGDNERHWGAVERYLSGGSRSNVFVLDFTKPRGGLDPAYPVIKQMLTKAGYLSQFVNFNTHEHISPRDPKRSNIILQGVARQILQKCGVRLWYVNIPRSVQQKLPALFIGVDVFHAPRVYDPKTKQRVAKASCAAIIIQAIRPDHQKRNQVEIYSETVARSAGEEYGLQDALKNAVKNAMQILKVTPKCAVIWRDGIGDSAFDTLAFEEIAGIRAGLASGQALGAGQQGPAVPLTYIVAQKRIQTKFAARGIEGVPDGKFGAPPGTLVEGIQGLDFSTFYIQGRAPPFSTPKPVRFVVVQRDPQLASVEIPQLTWAMCHDYPNWPGPIKVPSVCQQAHRLAELGGNMSDCGASIDHRSFANRVHFL